NHLEKNLFEYDVRIGVNRKNHQDGFFKKEYIALASEYAFSIFATIDDNSLDSGKYTVLMGQGKVPFAVSFEKADENCEKNFYDKIAEKLKGDSVKYPRIYCLSDMLVNESGMYNGMLLAITKTRDFRSFKTENGGSVKKGMLLHRLISAGSVFIPQEPIGENFLADWAEATAKQKNAANIGFNKIISIEKGK
ncbi:MAG: hypothetical protein J6C89_06645, partial [Clostridia bacterium]|nr:hypothetical protein [Clostridia bacterium]